MSIHSKLQHRAAANRKNHNVAVELPKVAVCITGQLSRLELDSKVQNLLIPLSKQHHVVHLFTALETGEAQYVNPATAGDVDINLTKEEVQTRFHPFYQAGSFRPHVTYAADISHWSPVYLSDKPKVNRSERLASHMSQHSTVKLCVDLIESQETHLGIHYDVVIKIRDNTMVAQTFRLLPPRAIDGHAAEDSILVKECGSNGGINDKVMILPRRHLSATLGGTISALMGVQNGDPNTTATFACDGCLGKSPEALLLKVLQVHNVPIIHASAAVLPFVDARYQSPQSISSKAGWCPVADWKDCWPQGAWDQDIPKHCVWLDPWDQPHNTPIWCTERTPTENRTCREAQNMLSPGIPIEH